MSASKPVVVFSKLLHLLQNAVERLPLIADIESLESDIQKLREDNASANATLEAAYADRRDLERSVIDLKMSMLAFHHTQIELMRVMHRMDDFFGEMKIQSRELGERVGVDYAEAYWQHLGGGFQKDPILQEALKDFLPTLQEQCS